MSEGCLGFEMVVVGAGPAGLAAATVAAECGRKVAVLDDTPWLGGQIWRGEERQPSAPESKHWGERFRRSGAVRLDRTAAIAAPWPGVLLTERVDGPREIHWQRLVLATGARELFLPFPGWTLPGVLGPGGLLALVKHGWPVDRQRIVVAGSGPLLLAAADGLRKHGAHVVCIAEQAPWRNVVKFGLTLRACPAKLWQAVQLKLRLLGVPYRCGVWPVCAEDKDQVRHVKLTDGQRTWSEECDLFACGFGLVPNVELPLALGCELDRGNVRVDLCQATTVPNVYCAGEPTGIGGADNALVEGQIAGYAAAGRADEARRLFPQRNGWHAFRQQLQQAFLLRTELASLATDDTLVCRCEDVSLRQMRQYNSWREAKLLSRCGMGSCQGRVCGAAAKVILGWGMESVRPPVLPARVESLISRVTLLQPSGSELGDETTTE
jgi:D-hydroxyproline dehydrogenase subunit alpha